jgi:DNA-binding transcriptional regulator GbsR (MarR family)
MDQPTSIFVDNMGLFGLESGIPRSVARLMGYMLICQPPQQSAIEIQKNLSMSAGAVSNALLLLQRVGLVRRVVVSGQRQLHYEIDADGWHRTIEQRFQSIPRAIKLAEAGLELYPDNPRLQSMRSTYAAFDHEITAIIAKLARNP